VRQLGQSSQFCTGVGKEKDIWKEAAVQNELKPGSRGIVIVRSRCQETTIEDIEGITDYVIVICSYDL
jgi:hypothetical protein